MRNILVVLVLLVLVSPTWGDVCTELAPRQVAVSPAELYANDADPPEGFLIEFFDMVSAEPELCWAPTYHLSTIRNVFRDVANGTYDIGIGPLTITYERELLVDFVHYGMSPLAFMVRNEHKTDLEIWAQALTSPAVLWFLAALLFVSLILAILIGYLEHGQRTSWQNFKHSFGESAWSTFRVVATFDIAAFLSRSKRGRLLTTIAWFIGWFLLVSISAKFTSGLTIAGIEETRHAVEDLWSMKVATKGGTFTEEVLRQHTRHLTVTDTLSEAVSHLLDEKVDVVVHDRDLLKGYLIEHPNEQLMVTGEYFEPRDYGFILPNGSPDRERMLRAVLRVQKTPEYLSLRRRWFGDD